MAAIKASLLSKLAPSATAKFFWCFPTLPRLIKRRREQASRPNQNRPSAPSRRPNGLSQVSTSNSVTILKLSASVFCPSNRPACGAVVYPDPAGSLKIQGLFEKNQSFTFKNSQRQTDASARKLQKASLLRPVGKIRAQTGQHDFHLLRFQKVPKARGGNASEWSATSFRPSSR